MAQKSVAVLDIRSTEVTVFVGERGVNDTFVFKASRTESYGGYEDGVFYKEEEGEKDGKISDAILRAISAVEQVCGERIRMLYVGVPGVFTKVVAKEQDIGFPKKRKIVQKDLDALVAAGTEQIKGFRYMRASSMIYVTNDKQRVIDPIGISTAGLTGCISYFYCSEYFCSTVEDALKGLKINVRYLPTQFAMATYLIPSETRDECALFLDAGSLASSLSIVLGNGIMAQESFGSGKVHVALLVMERLNVPYEVALTLLHRANLFAKQEEREEKLQILYRGEAYEFSPALLAEAVAEGLDGICEKAEEFLEGFDERELDCKPLFVSGEGLSDIRGAIEHISKRLNRLLEPVAPNLPYYNKPAMSSRIALADMAYDDNCNDSFLRRILNGFGG